MQRALGRRLMSVGIGAVLALGGVSAVAGPAAASAASTAFSQCMDGYLNAQRIALNAKQDKAALAILYTGYTFCYYDLSQRTDISGQTEINAINNYNTYLARAQQAITASILTYYGKTLKSLGLRGLTL
jgi:hypothetical protein